MIKGNKGEWSELYTLLYILGTGRIYAANENVQRVLDLYYPVIRIIRNEDKYGHIDYYIRDEEEIEIVIDGVSTKRLPTTEFIQKAEELYLAIVNGGESSFAIPEAESFMKEISCERLVAPSSDKTDITMQVHDVETGHNPICGFSIKSELGNPPTLLNASGATNFTFHVTGLNERQVEQVNSINTKSKIRDRINMIYDLGGNIDFVKTMNATFAGNLMMIDTRMEEIIAEMLLYSYRSGKSACRDILKHLDESNPLQFPREGFYSFKMKKFLVAVALGLTPGKEWNGIEEANGGYLIVTSDGSVLAYHLYNRNCFEDYLLNNTKLERGSTSRHNYAYIFTDQGECYINLNLQIRFV